MIDAYQNTLPVTASIAESAGDSEKLSVVILQHILPDTRQFVKVLQSNDIHVPLVVAKPNSIHEATLSALRADGILVASESYETFESTDTLDILLAQAADAAAQQGRRLAAIDIGGYFRKALSRLDERVRRQVVGVTEVTTFGHNRYLESLQALQVPVISLARSPLKCAEAHIVGDSAVTAADLILRRHGVLMQGRRAGVIGFGYIGEAIAESLKARGLSVTIYDKDPKKLLRASLRGYQVGTEKHRLLGECDIVFSSTGSRAVDYADLAHAKDGLTLVSAGSKANEFDMEGIRTCSTLRDGSDAAMQLYRTSWGKRLRTLCNGCAVNFHIQSCPEEVMDVVFAEQLACCRYLAAAPRALGVLHELPDAQHRDIAALWLQHYKRDSLSEPEPWSPRRPLPVAPRPELVVAPRPEMVTPSASFLPRAAAMPA